MVASSGWARRRGKAKGQFGVVAVGKVVGASGRRREGRGWWRRRLGLQEEQGRAQLRAKGCTGSWAKQATDLGQRRCWAEARRCARGPWSRGGSWLGLRAWGGGMALAGPRVRMASWAGRGEQPS